MRLGTRHQWAWAIAGVVINVLHYVVLGLLAGLAVVGLLVFLTHDSDHRAIRARIDEVIEVWTAPRGAARKCSDVRSLDHSGRA
ncbi:MAG TPA: hypothetical protein PK264_05225, partial [Hyphomicrobiaceae bacterium]|nr:hypothetical protein [Hyphomicrobiaceae bacterium]